MLKKLNNLSFVIGLFFFLISIILLIGFLKSTANAEKVNLYTGLTFFAFGTIMMMIKNNED